MAQEPPVPILTLDRTLHQIGAADGTPYQSYATDPVWVTQGDPYAMTEGNNVLPLTTGKEYFRQLAEAIRGAERSIYLLGWQVNWDVMLTSDLRLYDSLLGAAKARTSLKIYVLPWAGDSQMPTYVAETLVVLNSINETLGANTAKTKRVFAVGAKEHPNSSAGASRFFSHHQKQAVIDERIAFMGGVDVAYGRGDDASFSLDASARRGNDSYNGCLPHLKGVRAVDYVDGSSIGRPETIQTPEGSLTDARAVNAREALRAGKIQYPTGGAEVDASRQPRMPWQDLHLRIEGPAVFDLVSNFVLRWNSANERPRLPLPPKPVSKKGGCQVQMLRSASGKMVELEAASVTASERSRVHDHYAHNHIHHAMVHLIEKANHFIYIENQFFVSAFGAQRFGDGGPETDQSPAIKSVIGMGLSKWATRSMPGDGTALPKNLVCSALGRKLRSVIMNSGNPAPDGKRSPFHIYITLPVHSEGMLNDPSTMTQVHYTMQSLVFGSQSLINQTRRAILARGLWQRSDQDYDRAFKDGNYEYEAIPIEECWPYITLLNLRNWDQRGDRYSTEQIYVHTKMMIVDDLYAIVGSANINDRSQLGDRDSELAALVMDTDYSMQDIGAVEGPQLTRKFARELRIEVWNKLFCLAGAAAKVKKADSLIDAVKKPAAQASWEAIRAVAEKNTIRYEASFAFIPRNARGKNSEGTDLRASIWPTKYAGLSPINGGLMPFEKAFWDRPQHAAAAKELSYVQGFVTLLPWLWTLGEDNNSGYHSALYVDLTPPRSTGPSTQFATAASKGHGAPDVEDELSG